MASKRAAVLLLAMAGAACGGGDEADPAAAAGASSGDASLELPVIEQDTQADSVEPDNDVQLTRETLATAGALAIRSRRCSISRWPGPRFTISNWSVSTWIPIIPATVLHSCGSVPPDVRTSSGLVTSSAGRVSPRFAGRISSLPSKTLVSSGRKP